MVPAKTVSNVVFPKLGKAKDIVESLAREIYG